jgi:hypothetical protein
MRLDPGEDHTGHFNTWSMWSEVDGLVGEVRFGTDGANIRKALELLRIATNIIGNRHRILSGDAK